MPNGTHIDEGIEFDAKLRIVAHEAGNPSVQFVEYGAEDDEPGGGDVPALDGVVQSHKTARQVADGEDVRQ